MRKWARSWEIGLKLEKVYSKLRKYEEYEKVWESMGKYEKL